MADMSMPQTTDGQPPMSLLSGGNNVVPPTQTITVPMAILQHPAVQAGVQQAQSDMAKQAAMMPKANDISMGDERTQAMIKNMQAMRNSGLMAPLGSSQNHPVAGGIANAMMAFGQGITHQPFLSDFQQQQQARNQQLAEQSRYGMLTPEQQVMLGFRQANLGLAQDRLSNTKSNQQQNQWTAFLKNTNPETASSRSTLGMAGNGNLRIDRALVTLNNPKVKLTPQILSSLTTDLAAQYSGGVPTDQGMGEQQYNTIQGKLADLKQFLTSSPQELNTPEIKQQLIDTFNTVKDINSQSIRGNLDAMEAGQDKLISQHGEAWKNYRAKIESKFAQMSGQQQAIAAPTGSVGQQVTQATAPFQVGQSYNGHKILNVQKVG